MIFLSIILPTYKPQSYIYDCINSFASQSSSKDVFELVIVLNGPKEPYFSELEGYLLKSGLTFKLLYSEIAGVSNARNMGLNYVQKSEVEYVMFIDDDDLLSNTTVEDCLKKADGESIIVCNTKTFVNDITEKTGVDYISHKFKANQNREYDIFRYRSFLSSICAKLIPMKVISDFRFNPNYALGEDSLFGFQISCNVDNMKLANETSIYYRRIREGSASRGKRTLGFKIKNYSRLIASYTSIYVSDIKRYNFVFYASRVYASFLNILK